MRRILTLGYFGYVNNQIDGQTIKTRNVLTLLESYSANTANIEYFDTQDFQTGFLSAISLFKKVIKSKTLVYLPAHNNLTFIFPLLYVVSKIFGVKILYIVIGGWLDEFLRNKRIHRYLLKRIPGIFLENKRLKENLMHWYGFSNLKYFPNFRIHSFTPTFNDVASTMKIVFMGRVIKEKGIDTLFMLAKFFEREYEGKEKISIDIIGPLPDDEKDFFYKNLNQSKIVTYKGIVDPQEIYSTLNQYDLLVLPTRYPGEGFPGTILDAYISGIPVIATNWRFIPEFIEVGKTGYIVEVNNVKDMYLSIENLIKKPDLLKEMKYNSYKKSKEFTPEVAWKIIRPYIEEKY